MEQRNRTKTADGWSIAAGLWLVASPYVLGFSGMTIGTNTLVLGALVAAVALFHMLYREGESGLDWLNVVFGVWLVAAPFFMGAAGVSSVPMWNSIVSGIVVGSLALWASLGHTIHTTQRGRPSRA